jgi:hypothetical protein
LRIIDKIAEWLRNTLLPQSNETFKVVVLCVFTATTFWFFNALNDNYSTRISYPIAFNYADSGLVAVEELPAKVEVNVSGGGWNLLRKTFWFAIEPVVIPLDNPTERKYILGSSLFSDISDHLDEIQLNFIDTDTLWLHIDSIRTVRSRIIIDSLGIDTKDNFHLTTNIKKSVDTASFTGPKRYLSKIPPEIIISIPEKEIDDDYDEDLILPTFGSSLVKRNPVEVNVQFGVEKFVNQELMVPFTFINAKEDSARYNFENDLATVKFSIQESIAGSYALDSLEIAIDFNKVNPQDSLTIPVLVKTPEKLKGRTITILPIKYSVEQ